VFGNWDIQVGDNGWGDEDCQTRGKFNHKPTFPKNEVATFLWVVATCRIDGADSKRKVGEVSMRKAAGPRTKVDGCGCPDKPLKVQFIELEKDRNRTRLNHGLVAFSVAVASDFLVNRLRLSGLRI
jgi:hypothetical protein